MPVVVDVEFAERYWYPDDGGQVWLSGYQLVDPVSGSYLARDAPLLAERGLRVSGVAGTQFRPRRAGLRRTSPRAARSTLRREPANQHDANAIAVARRRRAHVGFVPRELAAELAPELDAGRPWSAVVLREQRASPRDPRSGRDDAAGARGLDRAPRGRLTLRHAAPRRTVRAPGRAPVTTPGRPLRRGRRRPDHRARVPAADGGAGRLARRRLPRRGAAGLDRAGARGSASLTAIGVGARVQLLPHPADRPLHDRRERELGRARGLPDRGGDRQLGRAGRPRARAPRPSSAGARPTSPPRWRGCCCAATCSPSRCPPRRSGSPTRAGPAVGGDRARARSRATSGASRSRCAKGRPQLGTLLVPAELPEETLRRARRSGWCRSLEALLAAGARSRRAARRGGRDARAAPRGRRQDALLRSVSHDLRSPLTAIVAAGEALASPTLTDEERRELGA